MKDILMLLKQCASLGSEKSHQIGKEQHSQDFKNLLYHNK